MRDLGGILRRGAQLHPRRFLLGERGFGILRSLNQVLGRAGGQHRHDDIAKATKRVEIGLGEGFVHPVVPELFWVMQRGQRALAAKAVQPLEVAA